MRRARAAGVVAVTAVLTVGSWAGPAWACTYVERSVQANFRAADAVFVGRVSYVETAPEQGAIKVASVAVQAVYKGDVPATVLVRTPATLDACGIPFVPGERYAIFGSVVSAGVRTDLRVGTSADAALLDDAGYEARARYGAIAATPPPAPVARRTGPIAAASILLAVAIGTMAARIMRARAARTGAGPDPGD